MIKKVDLENLITDASMLCFETDIGLIEDIPNIINLKNNEISELIRFAKTNNIKTVLYSYNHFNNDVYQISEDMLSEYDSRVLKNIEKKVNEHNQYISMLDFSRPARLFVYCLFEGCCFTIIDEDYWIDELNVLDAKEKLDELLLSCNEILEEILVEEENKKVALKSRLKELILADAHFFQCTNQKLRRTYIIELMERKTEYKDAFSYYTEPIEYAEFIWKVHKSNS